MCKTTICLGKYEGKKTTVKKMYENIGLLELWGPLAPLFYIGLWEAFLNLFVTGGRIYPGTTRSRAKKYFIVACSCLLSPVSYSCLLSPIPGSLAEDSRYQGKKGSRRKLDQDEREHEEAELGHMFQVGDGEEGETDDEEDDADEDEDMEEEYEEEAEEEEQNNTTEKLVKKSDGFSFDADTDFGDYGGMDDDSEDEDEEEEDADKSDDEDEDSEEEEEGEEEETTKTEPFLGLVQRESADPKLKAAAVVGQLSVWDSLLEQRILLQKLLTKVNTFPQDLSALMEVDDTTHAKEVTAGECLLSEQVCPLPPGEGGWGRPGAGDQAVRGAEELSREKQRGGGGR